MWLTKTAITRPVAILMLVLALVVLGLQGLTRMPAEKDPKVDFPYVSVFTTYTGTSPAEMETLISKPIEDAVSSVSCVKNVTSVSQEGVSTVSIEFYLGTNLDVAASDVREKVDGVRKTLPTDADAPTISKADTSSTPVMYISMRSTAGRSTRDLRDLADNTVSDFLGQVPGIASIVVTGGDTREIIVALDKNRLNAYGLTVSDVAAAIKGQNENVPAGRVTETNRDYTVRLVGEFTGAQQIQNMRLQFAGKDGGAARTLRISDIGTVSDTVAERTGNASFAAKVSRNAPMPRSEDTVTLVVNKTSDGNTVTAAEGVKKQLDKLKKLIPGDVVFTISNDQSVEVHDNLADVEATLALGAFLAVSIVFLFLHNLRGTLIVALAIPTSIIATFLVLYSAGFTLNTMTLMGLSLAVGILVDDSIVVLENIYRHLQMGETPQEAALNGRGEIGLAAVTITLVDVVVFIPVAFMGGIVGQFFRSFGITVATATLFSLLMSFTLAPMLAARWYKKGENLEATGGVFGAINHFLESLNHGYRRALVWALKHRGTVIYIGNMLLVLVVLWMASAGSGVGMLPVAVGIGIFMIFASVYFSCGRALGRIYYGNETTLLYGLGGYVLLAVFCLLASHIPHMESLAAIITLTLSIVTGLIVVGVAITGLVSALISRTYALEPLLVTFLGAIVVFGVVATSGQVGKPLGFRFAPGQDQAQVTLTVELPASASLAATDRVLGEIEDRVRDMPEIKYIQSSAGSTAAGGFQGGGSTGLQYGQVQLTLYDKEGTLDRLLFWKSKADMREKTDVEVAGEVRQRVADIVGAKITTTEVSGFNGSAAPVQIELDGPNLDELLTDAHKVEAILGKTPGILTPDISYKATKPEVQVVLDRERAADRGLGLSTVASGLQDAIQGNIDSKFRDKANGNQYNIRVQYAHGNRESVEDVGNTVVGSSGGTPVTIAQVADVQEGRGPVAINRRNRQRQVTVSAYLAPGKVIGNMQQVIDPQIKALNLGKATYQWQGEANSLAEEGQYMVAALLLAVLLVYMLMAALFNNLLYPLIIMLTIPQALVGGLLAMLVANQPLSIIAMIGVIMLMGLVTKNAILLVDFANTLRARGYRREDALTEAGPTRLRPILMTTLAQILGALPIALALGRGSEFRQGLGIVIIGGLCLSSILTLLVIPCSYTVFDDISAFFGKMVFRRRINMEDALSDDPTLTRAESRRDA